MAAKHEGVMISKALYYGWNRTKQRFLFMAAVFFGTALLIQLPSLYNRFISDNELLIFLNSILLILLGFAVSWGMTKIAIAEARGQRSDWPMFFGTVPEYARYLLVSFAYTVITFVGIILFIVPGIIWSIKYQYMPFLAIDKKMDVSDAMTASAKMTDGVKWDLLALDIITGIINMIGFFALFVGLLMTVPTTYIAKARVYTQLLSKLK